MIRCALVMLAGVLIASGAQIMLKISANKKDGGYLSQYLNPLVIGAYIVMVLSTLCTLYAYRAVPLSSAPIWDALSQISVISLSCLVLKEKISKKQRIGILVVAVGFVLFLL